MTNVQLCQEFDSDILFDAHGLAARIRRSEAATLLTERGRSAVADILSYLRTHVGLDLYDLRQAWEYLLNQIAWSIDPDHVHCLITNIDGWNGWIERHVRPVSV